QWFPQTRWLSAGACRLAGLYQTGAGQAGGAGTQPPAENPAGILCRFTRTGTAATDTCGAPVAAGGGAEPQPGCPCVAGTAITGGWRHITADSARRLAGRASVNSPRSAG